MEQEITRSQYFNFKGKYLVWHTLLVVTRLVCIFLLVALLGYISIYSLLYSNSAPEDAKRIYDILSMISRILLPILIFLWIAFKIVVVIFKKKLKYMKYKLNITDEI